jgi:hypothetical protein
MNLLYKEWVIDASMDTPPGTFCFIPVKGIDTENPIFITGMNLISDKPPGRLRGIIHEDGQAAVGAFMEAHRTELAKLEKEKP